MDPSWRVRYAVCESLHEVLYIKKFGHIYGSEVFVRELLPFYIKFSKDPEDELKIISARSMLEISKIIDSQSFKSHIIPLFNIFYYNEEQLVKSFSIKKVEMSKVILKICPVIGNEIAKEAILPQFMILLNDKLNEVKINLLMNLECILPVFSFKKIIPMDNFIKNVVKVVENLIADHSWRNRRKTLETLPFIAKSIVEILIQTKDLFTEFFLKFMILALKDKIYEVRLNRNNTDYKHVDHYQKFSQYIT